MLFHFLHFLHYSIWDPDAEAPLLQKTLLLKRIHSSPACDSVTS